jgi:hypothetical protein
MPKSIRVQRLVGIAEEADIEALDDAEALLIAEEAVDGILWEETEVITHYQIVDTLS